MFCRLTSRMIAALLIFALGTVMLPGAGRAATASDKIDFTQETLDNGLNVIYAPLHQAPVVHVRVLYHVGSRDERPDRQGFAHMFEHMMFRGSAHVAPEEHMKLIGVVGGISNAFTSFDQTCYWETLPAEALEMALYLEADRMSSFKVSDSIFKTERNVVAEEWRMGRNRPYGTEFEDFFKSAFTKHSYRWTPIGDMDDLRAAASNELQEFFNTYYVPNNATLIIAGDIDVPKAQEFVRKYFGWVPRGASITRSIPTEPKQTEPRESTVTYRVPLDAVMIGYKLPPYRSPDQDPLELLSTILGGGSSSRLHRLLVDSAEPLAVSAVAGHDTLEDAGLFIVRAMVMRGKDPKRVAKMLDEAVADVVAHGVTQEELDKAKTEARLAIIHGRETAQSIATQLGEEAVFGGDANRVNTELARIDAVTVLDIQRVAQQYLKPSAATTLRVKADPTGKSVKPDESRQIANAAVAPSTEPVKPRPVEFPPGYPSHATVPQIKAAAHFEKGAEFEANRVRVIVMRDSRLPLVSWTLTTRTGSHADPAEKQGLSSLADAMMRRGVKGMSYEQLNQDLESRGIGLSVSDGGDVTELAGSCTSDQLDHAMQRTRQVLLEPTFPADEFRKLREQTVNRLALQQENPAAVAGEDLSTAMYGDSPLGRVATPQTVQSLTLDEVKDCYRRNVSPSGALMIFAGDVTVERARDLSAELFAGWKSDALNGSVSYAPAQAPASRRIILVDRPGGKGSTVRMAVPAYDIHSPEKFAGAVASQILSSGIESRLGKYVRAEKGYAYTVRGTFQPNRHGGLFAGAVDTALEHTADAIEAMFKVLEETARDGVTPQELAEAKTRVSGGMLMGMQTIGQQAGYRMEAILDGYPQDYYDLYPSRVNAVTAEQVRDVLRHYVNDGAMTIVVVAPASQVKEQLQRVGEVTVVPMPARRSDAQTNPAKPDALKPAA